MCADEAVSIKEEKTTQSVEIIQTCSNNISATEKDKEESKQAKQHSDNRLRNILFSLAVIAKVIKSSEKLCVRNRFSKLSSAI